MNDNIERVMRSYFMVAFVVGCGIYRHPNGYPRRCISILYIACVWSIYIWSLYNILTIFIVFPKSLLRSLNFFMVGVNLFNWMVSIFITFYKYKEQEMCMMQLNLIDDTLEKLGISKEYDRLRKEIKWSLISWITLICTMNTFDALLSINYNHFINSVIIAIIAPWIIDYSLHINTILDLIIVFILRQLHLELCRVGRTINALYGMRTTVQTAAYFVVCIALAYFQYHALLCFSHFHENGSTKWFFISSITLWSTLFLVKVLISNHICESVSAKAEKTKFIIHGLTNQIRFADMYDEIYQFGLQISLYPLRFSGMGLFYFGYKFVRSFAVWVFTITLFLVQVDTATFVLRISSATNTSVCLG